MLSICSALLCAKSQLRVNRQPQTCMSLPLSFSLCFSTTPPSASLLILLLLSHKCTLSQRLQAILYWAISCSLCLSQKTHPYSKIYTKAWELCSGRESKQFEVHLHCCLKVWEPLQRLAVFCCFTIISLVHQNQCCLIIYIISSQVNLSSISPSWGRSSTQHP